VPSSTTIKAKQTAERSDLEKLYKTVRSIRESKEETTPLTPIFKTIKANHPSDWLLVVEIAELLKDRNDHPLLEEVLNYLEALKQKRPKIEHLITGGLDLIFGNITIL
jgi:phenylalanine-4-hydroxylase